MPTAKDITNIKLGNLMTIEFLIALIGFIVSCTLVWGSLNAQVQANAQNDKVIIATQTKFADSIEQIKTNQEIARVEIEHIKLQLKSESANNQHVRKQIDDIKTLLISLSHSSDRKPTLNPLNISL